MGIESKQKLSKKKTKMLLSVRWLKKDSKIKDQKVLPLALVKDRVERKRVFMEIYNN